MLRLVGAGLMYGPEKRVRLASNSAAEFLGTAMKILASFGHLGGPI